MAILIFTAVGWYFGLYRLKKYGSDGVVIRDSLATAIFGLSALVLGFTFHGSVSKYTDRMQTIRIEAQTLQSVNSLITYLQPSDQLAVKKSLENLLDTRLSAYINITRLSDIDSEAEKITIAVRQVQEDVMRATLNTSAENKTYATNLLVPKVGNLVAVFESGTIDAKSHPPILLMRFLIALLCIGAFLIGYTMVLKNETDWLLASLYMLLIGLSLYVILSLEFPSLSMSYGEINRDFLRLKDVMK